MKQPLEFDIVPVDAYLSNTAQTLIYQVPTKIYSVELDWFVIVNSHSSDLTYNLYIKADSGVMRPQVPINRPIRAGSSQEFSRSIRLMRGHALYGDASAASKIHVYGSGKMKIEAK